MPDADLPDQSRGGDRDLLARFRAGDREAFTRMYRVHSPAVFRFALHMTGDRMKAAEITQDVFVWLIHHPEKFDPQRGELGVFLIGVTRKLLLRQHQNERRWIPLEAAHHALSGLSGAGFGPSGSAESQTSRLREAIAALPPRYREVVVLCDLEGRTYEAAAVALECAVGTVRSRLHRARGLLGRKLLSEKGIERCAV
jgi:RNA polymerase sigma-70 factor (ECF subfamily)